MLKQLLFYLKVSRPGLWFATGWLYLLPTSQVSDIIYSPLFWYGLFYTSFPLNFLVYGWNDIVDYETDILNPRKNSFWFGAQASKSELSKLWKPILIVQVITTAPLFYFGGLKMVFIFAGFFLINWLYNLPQNGLRSKPPWELLCQVGYLLIVPLSVILNETEALPWQTYLYLFLFSMQSHLMGEVMDFIPDRAAGRETTTTKLGLRRSKLLIILIMVGEIIILFQTFKEYIFGGVLALGLLWLILDLFVIYRTRPYTVFQMKLFAFASNLIALVTIAYVWYSGCLTK